MIKIVNLSMAPTGVKELIRCANWLDSCEIDDHQLSYDPALKEDSNAIKYR